MQEVTVEKSVKKRVFFDLGKERSAPDPANVVLLAQDLRTCLGTSDGKACGGDLELSNDDKREYVCRRCGRVWGSMPGEERVPFCDSDMTSGHAESNVSPETHLDWGGGLGSKVDQFLAADVLGDSGDMPEGVRVKLEEEMLVQELLTGLRLMVKNGKFRDPSSLRRASHMQVPLTNPLLKELLTLSSDVCKKYDFYKSRDDGKIWFSDKLGIYLIHVGRFYAAGKRKRWCEPWRIVAAIFCHMFEEMYPQKYHALIAETNAKDKYRELCLPKETVNHFWLLAQACNPEKLSREDVAKMLGA